MPAVHGLGEPITLTAAADLSAYQYQPVKVDSAGNAAAITAITDIPIGILQNAPISGDPASILLIGEGCSKIQLGATLAAGVRVSSSAAGKAVAAAATSYCLGVLLEGGALDELGLIAMIPNTPS